MITCSLGSLVMFSELEDLVDKGGYFWEGVDEDLFEVVVSGTW